ncbi:hypothetical protein GCM10025868_18850 [Angustibacter aerolatus]|uniref:Uncharacterized protein n=1 Tax=Angustibacter aerolatus TaxID=1162965 RepID=A0ABQ6JII0_9ACTN|nr:hypothetical protein [Angustibacter aerolatus]GMA86635.1 hypothetical protein GCM10025868_18850 [Angustibacter aerolatus]
MNGSVGVDPQAYVAHVGAVNVEVTTMGAGGMFRDAVGRGSGESIQAAGERHRHRVRPGVRAEVLGERTVPDVLNPATLPSDDNINPYAFCVDLDGRYFLSKGAMIAYYGQMRFEALTSVSNLAAFVAAQFSSPLYAQDWVVAQGHGKARARRPRLRHQRLRPRRRQPHHPRLEPARLRAHARA